MTIKYTNISSHRHRVLGLWLLWCAIIVTGCGGAVIAPPLDECDFGHVRFEADFTTGRLDRCAQYGPNQFELSFIPEDTPINSSPWYAFRIHTKHAADLELTLSYAGYPHRYSPKTSPDGRQWRLLEDSAVTRSESGDATLKLAVTGDTLWVAGQELIDNQDYADWLQNLSTRPFLSLTELGRSREKRPIQLLSTQGEQRRENIVLVGRQHPPEVTGALAMRTFAERLLSDDELAKKFRDRFGVYIVPNLNPDGVEHGNWRHNTGGVDLNRDWGPFTQPETQAMRNLLAEFGQDGDHRLALFLDFHSTSKTVFYSFPAETEMSRSWFTPAWVTTLQEKSQSLPHPEPVYWETNQNIDLPTSKTHVQTSYSVPTLTFELGDNSHRDFIRAYAELAADEMMSLLLSRSDS